MQSKNKSPFPLSKLPFDILENITSIIIKHERFKVIGSNIIFINRTFAKAAIPQVWKTIYIYEANEHSNHSSFNDLLLKKISRKKSFIKDIKRLSLNGTNFTNKGIINYIIPLLKDDNYNKTKIINSSSAEITNSPLQMLPKSTIECLFLGKINQQTFTSKGLRSLLLLCHENLLSLVIDLDHITSSSTSSSSLSPSYVLKDIIIPIFQNQKLQEIHLISDSWSEWNDFYPKPRSEHELKAKEALWRWTLKSYWGISNNLIESLSKSIKTLKIFTILATFISDYEALDLEDDFLNPPKPDPKYICYNNNNLDSWKERTKSRRGCLYAKYENDNSYIQYILEKKDFDHQDGSLWQIYNKLDDFNDDDVNEKISNLEKKMDAKMDNIMLQLQQLQQLLQRP
ncbi:8209_t:CDS:2 [Entrophospora sp. SA101]|nr:8207_t:CDS:2 [Entrophospora sp. SA101]CAJ0925792.1 8209_t:CDS:2 [Entrophospora sp. SA101]